MHVCSRSAGSTSSLRLFPHFIFFPHHLRLLRASVCLCVCENSMNISWLSVVAEPVPERGFGPATAQRNANHTLALMANMIASVTLVTPSGCICSNNKLEN